MENLNCNVIRDLLPLYIDDVCSPESKALIEQHLVQCEGCREELAQMREGLELSGDQDNGGRALKKLKKKIHKKYVILVIAVAVIAGGLTTASALMQSYGTPMWYENLNISVVQNEKDPQKYDLTFNGQPYDWMEVEKQSDLELFHRA